MTEGLPIKLSSPETREFWQIPVLFEDDCLLALAKPSRLLTTPDPDEPTRASLMGLLHRDIERKSAWARERGLSYLANAYCLDVETSGAILLAKDKATLVALADQFGSDKPLKDYSALVHGIPAEDAFEVDLRIAPDPANPTIMRPAGGGKRAHTRFEVVERFRRHSLLKCQPIIDRRHQIRAHLLARKFPVVGDSLYGGRHLYLSRLKPNYRLKPNAEERPLIDRAALHVERFQVLHPTHGTPLTVSVPWPKDLTVAVKYLRKFAHTTIESS